MKDLVGKKVFCKRNGTHGVVTMQDSVMITIETSGVPKQVTNSTFQRWYTEVPEEQDKPEEKMVLQGTTTGRFDSSKENKASKPRADKKEVKADETVKPANVKEPGIGLELRERFISLVKEVAENGQLDITYNEKNHSDIIKYNGRNVFECTHAQKRFNVLCHPNSLTPDNLKRVNVMFPKEWGWSLRAKFVFTEMTQWPLMRTIITDGLFYRESEVK